MSARELNETPTATDIREESFTTHDNRNGKSDDLRAKSISTDSHGKSAALDIDDKFLAFSDSLSLRQGLLFVEDICVKTLSVELDAKVGPTASSPFFVYSKRQILQNINAFIEAFHRNGIVKYVIGYALKANYNPHILREARESNCWVTTVSGNEVKLALREGFPPECVIFNGNGKLGWELALAVSVGCFVNIDSQFDLTRLISIAEKSDKIVRVLIRINPDIDPNVHPFLSTGTAKSKFGVEQSQLPEMLDAIRGHPHVHLVGLHCHLGSTINSAKVYAECLDLMMGVAENVVQSGFRTLNYVNIGGGVNIDYRKHELRTQPEVDFIDSERCKEKLTTGNVQFTAEDNKKITATLVGQEACLSGTGLQKPATLQPATVQELVSSLDSTRLNKSGFTLIVEPGRSIVGSAGTLITKVIGCKQTGSKRYVVVDGAMTDVIRPALYGAYHHIELIEPSSTSTSGDVSKKRCRHVYDVVGPVCECGDFLGKDRLLEEPHDGCGVAMFDVGAYCSSMSSQYNMRTRPAEVMVDGATWYLIREPETFDSLVSHFVE